MVWMLGESSELIPLQLIAPEAHLPDRHAARVSPDPQPKPRQSAANPKEAPVKKGLRLIARFDGADKVIAPALSLLLVDCDTCAADQFDQHVSAFLYWASQWMRAGDVVRSS